MSTVTLADIVAILDERYPPDLAADWDRVGTVCGDPDQPVTRVLLATDATAAVVDEAVAWGADLLLVLHPLLLRGVHSVAATTAKGAAVHRLTRAGCALHTVHTNADAALDGVPAALAQVLGLIDARPLEPVPVPPMDKHVVFVPEADAERVLDAMAAVGAGNIGEYARCAWTSTGTGTFVPSERANPAVGDAGVAAQVTETRLEMVAPRNLRGAVVTAMREAHPYEEPAFDVLELAELPGRSGHGRVGRLAEPMTLRGFAERAAAVLTGSVQGARVAGDLDATVTTVAVVGGSGDSFFDAVRAAGADVYLTGDLRHHPVLELRERARFEARRRGLPPESGRPFVVDLAHTAGERPWLAGAAQRLADDVADRHATTVETRVSELITDPWTAHLPNPSVED